MNNLRVSIVQGETRWHDPAGNRSHYGELIAPLHGTTDLVVLPETFTSGFSNDAIGDAETMHGPTVAWMREQAVKLDAAVTGSVQLRTDAGVFNRMLFATPDGGLLHYDKRHLFSFAREHERYAAGHARVIVEWKGWNILLQVCYDLRFPVWSRNRGDYDALLYVANWPARRREHWRALLVARAIENQAWVIGVNRTGVDGEGIEYAGDSLVIDPWGRLALDAGSAAGVHRVTLAAQTLAQCREKFPAHLDADAFRLDAAPD